jgi:hypothetical protein
MTGLKDLLYSLTTVIIRYHDAQARVKKLISESDEELTKRNSRALAKIIIDDDSVDFKTRLDALIKECPLNQPDRKPFLIFLLNEIISIKSLLNQKKPFDSAQFEEFKKQISKLFIDFNNLLSTPKSSACKITHNKTELAPEAICTLSGLVNDGWSGGDLCNSGIFLKDEVLERFHVSLISSHSEIVEISAQICSEHQNALLVDELKAQISHIKTVPQEATVQPETPPGQEIDIAKLKETNQQLTSSLSKFKVTLYLLNSQNMMFTRREDQLKKTIERQEETIATLTEKINDLSEESSIGPTSGYRSFFGAAL